LRELLGQRLMPVTGPLVSVDVTIMGEQAFCRLSNRTGSVVRFVLPHATIVVPGNSQGNVVADFVEGFSVSTEKHGLLFGDKMKTTRGGQPWNVRPVEGLASVAASVTRTATVTPPVVQETTEVADIVDPALLTVSEVLEYVENNPTLKKQVLKAETSGKGRVSLIASLSA